MNRRITAALAGAAALAATAGLAPSAFAAGAPCSAQAKACLQLHTNTAWLMNNGQVTRGGVPVTVGKPRYPSVDETHAAVPDSRKTEEIDQPVIDPFDEGEKTDEFEFVKIYANSHYVTPRPTLLQAIAGIKQELKSRLLQLNAAGRLDGSFVACGIAIVVAGDRAVWYVNFLFGKIYVREKMLLHEEEDQHRRKRRNDRAGRDQLP